MRKSTTLHKLVGLEEIISGELFTDDHLVNPVPPKDRDIAIVFRNYARYTLMDMLYLFDRTVKLHILCDFRVYA